MDYIKLLQVFTTATSLSAHVKRAYEDKKITKEELTAILAEGVLPLLAIFGVKLSIDALGVQETERSADVKSQVETISQLSAQVLK